MSTGKRGENIYGNLLQSVMKLCVISYDNTEGLVANIEWFEGGCFKNER
jgi:hypothetical protein